MKTLALMLLISTAAIADGVDDPNFYNDFDPNDPNPPAKYDKIAPPQWTIKRQNYGNVQPLPDRDCIWTWTGCNRIPAPIPEPSIIALIALGVINLFLFKKLRK